MFTSFLQLYFETDSWLWPVFAIASLGVFWIYHRWIVSKLNLQRQELIENEHWLYEAQQIGNIGSWYRNLSSGHTRWSPQLFCMYGVSRKTAPSFDEFYEIVHPDDREHIKKTVKKIETTGKAETVSYRVLREDGSTIIVENRIKGSFDENRNLVALYGSVLDVTERRAYEDSLKRVVAEAESANKAKGAFLSSVSHEIRTPLNAIIGFSSLMSEQELSEDQYKSFVESINAAGKSLSALINDILDLSALESLSFNLMPLNVDIRRIMQEVVSVFKLIVDGKGIALNVEIADDVPDVYIDGKRLRQILINIIGNAVKFTDKGSVDVHVQAVSRSGKNPDCDLTFKISDSGIGISQLDRTRIFREFEQARGEINRRFGGSGLGLSIVKQLLEIMGGAIELESTVGVGSTFTVKIFQVPLARKNGTDHVPYTGSFGPERFQGEFSFISQDQGASLHKGGDLLDLSQEQLEALRLVFKSRFAQLSKGVNIDFARQLSTDVHSWAVSKGDESLISFSKALFKYTASMDVGKLLKISSLIVSDNKLLCDEE